jgi:hypothetical protein
MTAEADGRRKSLCGRLGTHGLATDIRGARARQVSNRPVQCQLTGGAERIVFAAPNRSLASDSLWPGL